MTYYRLYCVGSDGKIEAAEWIEAASDEAAAMIVRSLRPNSICELWDHARLVARITPQQSAMAFFAQSASA
jgi:hypothetical protein